MKWTLMILLSLNFSTADSPSNSGCSVSAEDGETVILPVNLNLTGDSELSEPIITWVHESRGIVHKYWYYKDNSEHQTDHFKNRTSLFKEEIKKGNVSLKIINVTKNDTGKFICEVHSIAKIYVSLCVKEKEKYEDPTESPKPEQKTRRPDKSEDLTWRQNVVFAIGLLIVLAALIGVTVYLYKKRKARKRRNHCAKADNQAMETLKGGGEQIYSSEDSMASYV